MQDVVIAGAGIIGSSIALELTSRGISPLLVDRTIPGAESSWAAAGMLAPQLEHSEGNAAFELGLLSRALYPEWVREIREVSGIDPEFRVDGALRPFSSESELDLISSAIAWQSTRGLRVERVDRASLRNMVPGARRSVVGGLFFPDEGQVEPRLLLRALSFATARRGVKHLAGAAVRRVGIEHGRVTHVELEDRELVASTLIIAAGAWSSLIEGSSLPRGTVRPARGQMAALEGGPPAFSPFVATPKGYIIPRRDGRVLIGTTVEMVGYERAVTAAGLHEILAHAIDLLPELGRARILETWCALRPWTSDHRPIIGPTSIEGLYLATGHHRNGVLEAPATARIIGDLLSGQAPPMDVRAFSAARFAAP